jgi:leucyl aminopeptidase
MLSGLRSRCPPEPCASIAAAVSILPDQPLPALKAAEEGLTRPALDAADAACLLLPEGEDAAGSATSRLGHRETLQTLLARTRLRDGGHASVTLPNARQTLLVVGRIPPAAPAFDRLALAGRMLRDALAREPRRLALAAQGLGKATAPALEALAAAALSQCFRLPDYRTRTPARRPVSAVHLHGADARALPRLRAEARAGNLARWLTALPPNVLDASAYRRALAQLARSAGARFEWLGERELRRAGAGAFLAVAAGNASRDAGIARLAWQPRRGSRARGGALTLVGKGILFDTGGNNLKSHRSMLDMHTDMAGSAVALAGFLALAELRVPFPVECWLAITENRIGPSAYRPQDVVRAANGVTIQVIHTDAEGRMALADTLALASRGSPRLVIDFATLTGACVTALTERMSGVFTNRESLRPVLEAAGRASGERVWPFPMDADFDADLESKVADVVQCAVDGKGDHVLAARFLNRFVPAGVPWVHVDLASATRTGGLAHVATDVTGFGTRFLVELALGQRVLQTLESP